MNFLQNITNKRQLKFLTLTSLDFFLSFSLIKFFLDKDLIDFKKIFNIHQLIIFILFWILISYTRGRYLLNKKEKFFFKIIKDIKEIIIVSSITTIITFLLKIISLQNSFTSSNILLIYSILIPVSILNQSIFYSLFENIKAKIINVFILGEDKQIKYIEENFLADNHNVYKFKIIKKIDDIIFPPDHLIVSSETALNKTNKDIIDKMYIDGVEIYSSIAWCEKFQQRIPTELINLYESVNNQNSQNERNIQIILKRLGDITLGILLLIPSIPIIIISGLLIWLNDKGPIFYSQTREGLFRKHIKITKLRTMRVDAEKDGPQWSLRNDDRITFVGKFLRRMRIDELPQIFSVIKGEMSLIGPRPERPEFNIKLNELIPYYYLRNYVKPGLSGWAQVNYPYTASLEDSKNKLSYDIYYIRNFSCWIDFLILFKTARIIFSGIGSIPLKR
jgi:exopolysaccharide biosynthesis polyprenyl glycosylphosphotransferase